MFAGQAPITGDSLMVTVKEQLEDPQLLDALQVTVVVPIANVDPDAGVQTTIGVVPDAVGSVQVAVVLSHCTMLPGQLPITGL